MTGPTFHAQWPAWVDLAWVVIYAEAVTWARVMSRTGPEDAWRFALLEDLSGSGQSQSYPWCAAIAFWRGYS